MPKIKFVEHKHHEVEDGMQSSTGAYSDGVTYDKDDKWCYVINIPNQNGNKNPLDDWNSRTKTVYFPKNKRTFTLAQVDRFYRIVWDEGKLPTELEDRYTDYGRAAQAIQSYFKASK